MATFDIADEVQFCGVEELGCLLDTQITLPLLFSNGEERDAWALYAEDAFRKDRTHMRILKEIFRSGIGIGPDVEKEEWLLAKKKLDRKCRAVDAFQAPENKHTCSHAGARVARGDNGIGIVRSNKMRCNDNRRCRALSHRGSWVLVHANNVGTRNDCDIRRERSAGMRANHRVVTDKEEGVAGILSRPLETARHNLSGAVIAAHSVEGEADTPAWLTHDWLGVGRIRVWGGRAPNDLTTAIGAAHLTCMMIPFCCSALRAAIHRRSCQRMMRATIALAGFRCFSLWYAHASDLAFGAQRGAT
jgi:hypothetical protein